MTGINPTSELDDLWTVRPQRSVSPKTLFMHEFEQATST